MADFKPDMPDTRSRSVLGAGAMVFHRDQVLLVQVAYGRAKGAWIFPGGYLDAGEDPREAAAREVREETGLHVVVETPVAVRHRKAPDASVDHDVYFLFRARLAEDCADDPESKIRFQKDECLDARFWPLEQALSSEEIRPLTRYFLSKALGRAVSGPPPNFAGFVDAVYFF